MGVVFVVKYFVFDKFWSVVSSITFPSIPPVASGNVCRNKSTLLSTVLKTAIFFF